MAEHPTPWPTVTADRHGPVAVLTIDRPQVRNALDGATLRALFEQLTALGADPSVRAIVLTGTGDKAFSAGLDLKATTVDGLPEPAARPANLLRDGRFGTPVIAAVNGAAVGGGFELALACDLRVAADHAVFALPEVSRGIAASEGGTELPLQLPLAIALEIGLAAEPLSADRALQLGLVNRVVPADQVLPTAIELARRIAGHSPAAVAATKELMYRSLTDGVDERRAANRRATEALLAGPDAAEGAAAFVQKRPPRWADPQDAGAGA